jgi:hypothetical protein
VDYILNVFWSICAQRDTSGLNSENSELKLRLQTMEQQVHLQDGMPMGLYMFL